MHNFGLRGSVIHTTSAVSLCGGVLGGSSVRASVELCMYYFELEGSVIHTTSAAALCGGVLGGSSVWANMTELAYAALLC